MPVQHLAIIGLGSNLQQPLNQLRKAVYSLNQLPRSKIGSTSSVYWSSPLGPVDQPDFLNAVAKLATLLSPRALLTALKEIESGQGRVRDLRWGPRTIDLDILLYDDLILNEPDLCIPHPEICNRNFVVIPLMEVDTGLQLPEGPNLSAVAHELGSVGLKRYASADELCQACS